MKIIHKEYERRFDVGTSLPMRDVPIGAYFKFGSGGLLRQRTAIDKNYVFDCHYLEIKSLDRDNLVIISNAKGDEA